MTPHQTSLRMSQLGAAAVEFALVAPLFLGLVFAVMEFSRLMLIYSTAIEATRLGARVAAVCNVNDAAVVARMQRLLAPLETRHVSVTYPTGECSATTCDPVTVRLQSLEVPLAIPLVRLSVPVPDFVTSIPSESLDSTDNALCDG
jgi:hypothetical protein